MSNSIGLFERLKPLLPEMAESRLPDFRPLSGERSGTHAMHFRQGFSHEFSGHREYAPGDDLRYLDWKAYARSDRYHLKRFHDETSLDAAILLDVSPGMAYCGASGEERLCKFDHAKSLIGVISWLLLRDNRKTSLSVFDGSVGSPLVYVPLMSRWKQFLLKLESLETSREETVRRSAAGIFGPFGQTLGGKNHLVIVSDLLFDEPDMTLTSLKILKQARHSILVLQVLDPDELSFDLPAVNRFHAFGSNRFRDAESFRIKAAYRDEIRNFMKQTATGCACEGIGYVQVRTDEPLLRPFRELIMPGRET